MEKSILEVGDVVATYYDDNRWEHQTIERVSLKQAYGSQGGKFKRHIGLDNDVRDVFSSNGIYPRYKLLTGNATKFFEHGEEAEAIIWGIVRSINELEANKFNTLSLDELWGLHTTLLTFKR